MRKLFKKLALSLKITSVIAFSFLSLAVFAACCADEDEFDIRVVLPNQIPVAAAAKLMRDFSGEQTVGGATYNISFDVLAGGAPAIQTEMQLANSPQVVIAPTNLGAMITHSPYATDYRLAATITWGLTNIATSQPITTLEDLRGRRVIVPGGATGIPSISFRHVLASQNIPFYTMPGGTHIANAVQVYHFTGEINAYILGLTIDGTNVTALLPEPAITGIITQNNAQNHPARLERVDINEHLAEDYKIDHPFASVFFRADFVTNHQAFVTRFLAELKASIEWVTNADAAIQNEAIAYIMSQNTGTPPRWGLPAAEAPLRQSLTHSHIRFVTAAEGRAQLDDFFQMVYNLSPALIGGRLPADNFFMH
ncbi:MAG: hypothetical protein FWB72_02140 [Firmicutes bacterium]|nr:hypothetical protein [Bacillota bacterium]